MDKILVYQEKIKQILGSYIQDVQKSNTEGEAYLISDDATMHYLLYHNQWRAGHRIYGCILHTRIKNDKVYVEYDGTDIGFADSFADAGIPKSDIVLAFHTPAKRPHTGFAVA